MSQKHIVRQLLAAAFVILCFSLIGMMIKADPSYHGDLAETFGVASINELLIMAYLVLVSIPVGYSLSMYFSYTKGHHTNFIRWFWGFFLIAHLVLQILLLNFASPLHWLAALATVFMVVNHFLFLK